MMYILLYILLGLAAGKASGLIGLGGGVIIVPALIFGFGLSVQRGRTNPTAQKQANSLSLLPTPLPETDGLFVPT